MSDDSKPAGRHNRSPGRQSWEKVPLESRSPFRDGTIDADPRLKLRLPSAERLRKYSYPTCTFVS
jgi:hypothetical protein